MSKNRDLFVSLDTARELPFKAAKMVPNDVAEAIADAQRNIEIDGGSSQDRMIVKMAKIIESRNLT